MAEIAAQWKKNRRQIRLVIQHLNSLHGRALKKGTKFNELPLDNIYSKLILPLWVSILEIEFNILLCESPAFTRKFVDYTNLGSLSEYDKWTVLTTYFFKEQYLKGNHKRELTEITIGDTNYHRYCTIIEVIDNDIKPFIELRNRIAHGQWAVAFNIGGSDTNQKITQKAWTLSKRDLILLKAFVENLPPLLKVLIVSKETFERDYDQLMNRINLAKKDVDIRLAWLLKTISKT